MPRFEFVVSNHRTSHFVMSDNANFERTTLSRAEAEGHVMHYSDDPR